MHTKQPLHMPPPTPAPSPPGLATTTSLLSLDLRILSISQKSIYCTDDLGRLASSTWPSGASTQWQETVLRSFLMTE